MKRVISLSVQKMAQFISFRFVNGMMALSCLLIATACTNMGSKFGAGSTSTVLLSDPSTGGNGNGAFYLNEVNPDPNNPGTQYVLIGQNGEFDTYCGGSLGTCDCEYTYTQSNVGQQTVDVAVSYQEANMVRCPVNSVPSGINTFNVRLIVVPLPNSSSPTPTPSGSTTNGLGTNYYSNSLTVNLANGAFAASTTFIDLTNASSYVPVQRFQCRKRDFIKNPLDGNIIDPFQSQDPRVIYPFNFYTTNVGDSLLRMQQAADQSWDCTLTGGVLPTPTPGGATQASKVQWWANPNVFSQVPCSDAFCSGDAQLIYPSDSLTGGRVPSSNPSASGKRRSSFSLASKPYGVFQVPLVAATAPSDYVHSTYSGIGYAAKPIQGSNGTSSCPSIPLPPKSTWVKLWNFRASNITSPQIVTDTQSQRSSVIACNSSGAFPSCYVPPPGHGAPFGIDLLTISAGNLAGRVGLLASTVGDSSFSACYNIDQATWTSSGSTVSEKWEPSPNRFGSNVSPQVTLGQMQQFPWNVYEPLTTSNTISCGDVSGDGYVWQISGASCNWPWNYQITQHQTPQDFQNQLTITSLQTDNVPYTDQLFVVTDPAVDDNGMKGGSGSQLSQYTPVTYRAYGDCVGPTNSGCSGGFLWQNVVNSVSDASQTGADVFPLCVLQFYD